MRAPWACSQGNSLCKRRESRSLTGWKQDTSLGLVTRRLSLSGRGCRVPLHFWASVSGAVSPLNQQRKLGGRKHLFPMDLMEPRRQVALQQVCEALLSVASLPKGAVTILATLWLNLLDRKEFTFFPCSYSHLHGFWTAARSRENNKGLLELCLM